jgi:hypothetical protein
VSQVCKNSNADGLELERVRCLINLGGRYTAYKSKMRMSTYHVDVRLTIR